MKIRAGLVGFIAIVQAILLVAHLFLYFTWTFSPGHPATSPLWLKLVLGVLSISFLVGSLLAWRYTGAAVRAIYKIAAVWLGLLSFLFIAAVLSWLILGGLWVAGMPSCFHQTVQILFAAAAITGVYGIFNASWTRITRTTVRLANLPEAWRGRKAALISDLHLGHVRNGSFLRRIVRHVLKEKPDAIFIAGDLYDGTAIDAQRAAEPLSALTAPHGVYFVAGNHEQFGDDAKYLHAVEAAGVRVLCNEKVDAQGLQIIGVPYRHASHTEHFASVLEGIGVDRNRASILLTHAPDHPHVAEAPVFHCNSPVTRTSANLFLGAGWPGTFTANSYTG